jgi:hypothetical protein
MHIRILHRMPSESKTIQYLILLFLSLYSAENILLAFRHRKVVKQVTEKSLVKIEGQTEETVATTYYLFWFLMKMQEY